VPILPPLRADQEHASACENRLELSANINTQPMSVQWPRNQVAIWQCPRCYHVLQHEFSMYVSYSLEGNLWCPCYDLSPAQGYVELRTVTKMKPLNEAAVNHEKACQALREYHQIKHAEECQRQDALENWTYYGLLE
jgi:hypothetical protein